MRIEKNDVKKPVRPLPFSVVNVLTPKFKNKFAYIGHPPANIALDVSESYVVTCSLNDAGGFVRILSKRKVPLSKIEEVRSHPDTTPEDNEIIVVAQRMLKPTTQRKVKQQELACA